MQHIAQLMRTISQFPSADPAADADVDVEQLLGQARSRYKALCARLGIRPPTRTLRESGSVLGESGGVQIQEEQPPPPSTSLRRNKVWDLEEGPRS